MSANAWAEESPQARCSTVDQELLHLAFFVGEDDHAWALDGDGFDVAADSRLELARSLNSWIKISSRVSCGMTMPVTMVITFLSWGVDSSRTARDSSP